MKAKEMGRGGLKGGGANERVEEDEELEVPSRVHVAMCTIEAFHRIHPSHAHVRTPSPGPHSTAHHRHPIDPIPTFPVSRNLLTHGDLHPPP